MSATRAQGLGPLGIFGGTFDPVHNGHLRTAFELREALRLAEVRFLPTGNPPHRDQTQATRRAAAGAGARRGGRRAGLHRG